MNAEFERRMRKSYRGRPAAGRPWLAVMRQAGASFFWLVRKPHAWAAWIKMLRAARRF